MISIIISSYKPENLRQVTQNIEQTVGVPCEIIAIDNSKGKMGLCQVYNQGASAAKYETLCFAHEDILFQTQAWGEKVMEIFDGNSEIGIIGVAGGSYKPFAPSTWSFPGSISNTGYINIIQGSKNPDRAAKEVIINPGNKNLSEVVTIDGLWFCTRRPILLHAPFDEITFKGFHCYDIDFSLGVFQTHKVVVTFDIKIRHNSEGNYDRTWIEEVLTFHEKWRDQLPVNLENIPPGLQITEEKKAFAYFIRKMVDAGYSPFEILKRLKFSNKLFQMPGVDVLVLRTVVFKEASKRAIKKLIPKKQHHS